VTRWSDYIAALGRKPGAFGYTRPVTEIPLVVRPRCGGGFTTAIHAAEPPSRWSAEDAQDFLHAIMRALEAHGVYRLTVEEVVPVTAWVVTVVADSATAATPPLELSTDAAMELQRRAFRIPGATHRQQAEGARLKWGRPGSVWRRFRQQETNIKRSRYRPRRLQLPPDRTAQPRLRRT